MPVVPGCGAAIGPFLGVLLPLTLDGGGDVDLPVSLGPGVQPTDVFLQGLIVDLGLAPFFLSASNPLQVHVQ